MGDRNYTVITSESNDSDIVIYAHWGGNDNQRIVRDVLRVTNRIGDAEYLAAQIIHALFDSGHYDGTSGFGVSTSPKDSMDYPWVDNPTVIVNADTGNFVIGDTEFNKDGFEIK